MEISEAQLQKFMVLYEKEFGITLSPAEAQVSASSLLRLLAISIPPLEIHREDDTI